MGGVRGEEKSDKRGCGCERGVGVKEDAAWVLIGPFYLHRTGRRGVVCFVGPRFVRRRVLLLLL
eukprot:scaffold18673_cov87-Isochrysis_galbana.AAC.2